MKKLAVVSLFMTLSLILFGCSEATSAVDEARNGMQEYFKTEYESTIDFEKYGDTINYTINVISGKEAINKEKEALFTPEASDDLYEISAWTRETQVAETQAVETPQTPEVQPEQVETEALGQAESVIEMAESVIGETTDVEVEVTDIGETVESLPSSETPEEAEAPVETESVETEAEGAETETVETQTEALQLDTIEGADVVLGETGVAVEEVNVLDDTFKIDHMDYVYDQMFIALDGEKSDIILRFTLNQEDLIQDIMILEPKN